MRSLVLAVSILFLAVCVCPADDPPAGPPVVAKPEAFKTLLLFPRIPHDYAARSSKCSAAAWISGPVSPGRRTAWICTASSSRRHARRLSA